MDLSKETIENFSELEIIVHCLYEMTFIDYDENIIKDNLYELNNRIEEYEKLTEEEKKLKTISIDEFKRRFDNKDKP